MKNRLRVSVEIKMAVGMTDFEQGVWDYLCSHKKTPVQANKIAKEWIVSKTRVYRVLERFVENGIADVIRIGSKKFYKVKE
jgi:predicted transcriptional regulator